MVALRSCWCWSVPYGADRFERTVNCRAAAPASHMTHRHYSLPVAKPRPRYSGPSRAAALSGGAIVGGIVVILIVLGLVLYGMSKIITDAANTATSAPLTTGQGAAAPPPSAMARLRSEDGRAPKSA